VSDGATAGPPTALIAAIHATDTRCVLAVTGGGVAALSWLLGVPGASRTILEGTVPYATTALAELVGGDVEQAVSAATAEAMAVACLQRARRLAADGDGPLVGVAATAALVSDRPKRGEHRAHVAIATAAGTAVWSLTLAKGERDRSGEDSLVSSLVVTVLATACGLDGGTPAGLGAHDVLEEPAVLPR